MEKRGNKRVKILKRSGIWTCDFCKRYGLSIAGDGIIYCRYCGESYGTDINDLAKELIGEREIIQ